MKSQPKPNPHSSTFCVSPWMEMLLRPGNQFSPCSRNQGFEFDSNYDFFNQPKLWELRYHLNQNQQHPSCFKCWEIENSGGESRRQKVNRDWNHIWQRWLIAASNKPAIVELPPTLTCNQVCVMCGPSYSTLWEKHHTVFDRQYLRNWPGKSWEERQWQTLILENENLHRVNLVGGEPLLWKGLEALLSNLSPIQTQVRIVTNLNLTSVSKRNLEKIKQYGNYQIQVSLHGIEDTFDFISTPASWKQFEYNVCWLNQLEIDWMCSTTLQALNFFDMQRIFDWAHNMGAKRRYVNWVHFPPELSMKVVQKQWIDMDFEAVIELNNNIHGLDGFFSSLKYFEFDPRLFEKFQQLIMKWQNTFKRPIPKSWQNKIN